MQDLDQKEIDELDGDYVRMIKNVHQNIISRLQSSSIVFNFIEETPIPSAIINSNQVNTEQTLHAHVEVGKNIANVTEATFAISEDVEFNSSLQTELIRY